MIRIRNRRDRRTPILAERLAKLGRTDEARELLARFERRPQGVKYAPARAHFAQGEPDQGFD